MKRNRAQSSFDDLGRQPHPPGLPPAWVTAAHIDTVPCLEGTTMLTCAACHIGLRPGGRISTTGLLLVYVQGEAGIPHAEWRAVHFCRRCYTADAARAFMLRAIKERADAPAS